MSRPVSAETKLPSVPAIARGDLLPAMALPVAPGGDVVDVRWGRGPQVLVALHSAACDECRRYVVVELASEIHRLAEWGGRLVVVAPDALDRVAGLAESTEVQVLADPGRRIASGDAGVVITDEWGEVYFASQAGPEHGFPAPAEVTDWVRFIAIQCPECEGPEGEWKRL